MDLIVKIDDIFYKINGYGYDVDNSLIFNKKNGKSLKWNKVVNNYYIRVKRLSFRKEDIINWNTTYIDKDLVKEYKEIKKKCLKCELIKSVTDYKGKNRYCNKCLIEYKGKERRTYLYETDEDFRYVEDFLKLLKLKKWRATYLDLFKLIDCYDRYAPNGVLHYLDEKRANKILQQIINKHYNLINGKG